MDISPTMHQAVWCCHNVLEERGFKVSFE